MATLVMLITVIGVFFLLGWQLTRFTDDLPALKAALAVKGDDFQNWISEQFHMSKREQVAWFNTRISEAASTSGKIALSLFGMTGAALAAIVPLPVFVFLLILLRGKFKIFFGLLGETSDGVVLHIMERISQLSRRNTPIRTGSNYRSAERDLQQVMLRTDPKEPTTTLGSSGRSPKDRRMEDLIATYMAAVHSTAIEIEHQIPFTVNGDQSAVTIQRR